MQLSRISRSGGLNALMPSALPYGAAAKSLTCEPGAHSFQRPQDIARNMYMLSHGCKGLMAYYCPERLARGP